MGSCKRTIPHVVQFYVVVIGSQHFLEIRREPSICITTKYSLCLVFPGHAMIVGSIGEWTQRFRSATAAPLARTRSFGAIGNTSFHVPAAAHTSSYCNKSGSMNTRNCLV